MKRTWIVVAAFLLVPATTLAADWISIGKSTAGNEALIDAATVTTSGKMTRVWVKFIHSKPKASGIVSAKELHEINCSTREYRVVSFTDYAADGSVVKSGTGSYMPEPIVPETMAEGLHAAVCPRS